MTSTESLKDYKDNLIPLRLACLSTTDWPIVISLWYTYIDKKIYCATQKNAKIVQYINKSPKCGFEIAGDIFPYYDIRGYGKAKINDSLGKDILLLLIQKYLSDKKLSKLSKLLQSEKHLENEIAIEILPSKVFKYDYRERMKDLS
jgi:nitroimidazol reductase NimA-like FMN-containing flavoprotein (pyridoxamine 5'-phosphate oxidase superfamily)